MKMLHVYRRLPPSWQHLVRQLPLSSGMREHNRMLKESFQVGPPYRPSHRMIIIDITEQCNLGCHGCSRSCGPDQAPSSAHMTLSQIEDFIQESRNQGRRWEKIQIEGGEPTLHPDFFRIISALRNYIKNDSLATVLQVNTNGYSPSSFEILSRLPEDVLVYNSGKTNRTSDEHLPFNQAPVDLEKLSGYDFSQGCCLPAMYGLGLNRYGYYPHPNCGGIDRVFGFNIGRRSLPAPGDRLEEQYHLLCRFCGLLPYYNREVSRGFIPGETKTLPAGINRFRVRKQSPSWRGAYLRYQTRKPEMTRY